MGSGEGMVWQSPESAMGAENVRRGSNCLLRHRAYRRLLEVAGLKSLPRVHWAATGCIQSTDPMRQLHGIWKALVTGVALLLLVAIHAPAQQLARRLILKDGSYQLATKWEIKGERVRYYSAERDDWEEVPKSIVDWDATEKYEKDRAAGKPAPEAVELDKELEAERQADEAKSPHVAPGLRLPGEGGVVLLDTFQTQPQLVELEQSSRSVNKNTRGNILRAAVNPIASSKQSIEIPGLHAKIQSHTSRPSIYLNVASQELGDTEMPKGTGPELPWD